MILFTCNTCAVYLIKYRSMMAFVKAYQHDQSLLSHDRLIKCDLRVSNICMDLPFT